MANESQHVGADQVAARQPRENGQHTPDGESATADLGPLLADPSMVAAGRPPISSLTLLTLQRKYGNQAVQRFIGQMAPRVREAPAVARDRSVSAPAVQRAPTVPAPTGKTLQVAFYAFIPGTLGKAFKDYPHPKDLKNQAAFDAKVAAVTGSWIPEPGNVFKTWYCATDDRGFGGGASHRVGFVGTINTADIGKMGSKGAVFSHSCSPSHRVRAFDSGIFTSKNEIGDVEGPLTGTATAKSTEEPAVDSVDSSKITTTGAAAYAFMQTISPDIDYSVTWTFAKDSSGKINVSFSVTHNEFPFYEALVNGTSIYTYSSSDPGPTVKNLNSSTSYFVGPWPF